MPRKKWTPQEEITEALLKSRLKRKWQIALRRYVIENNPSFNYAPYFGLDIKNFRKWLGSQLPEGVTWEDFSSKWQLDHVIPPNYFDLNVDADLRLCWNFVNTRIALVGKEEKSKSSLTLQEGKLFFQALLDKTSYEPARLMLEKIDQIQQTGPMPNSEQLNFLATQKDYVETIAKFSEYEFDKLNFGALVEDIVAEREMLDRLKV